MVFFVGNRCSETAPALPLWKYTVPKATGHEKRGAVAPFIRYSDAQRILAFDPARTPGQWSNYLGTINELGVTGMSGQSAGGLWGKFDAGLARIISYDPQAPDVGGRNVYIKDMASGKFFSPAFRPARQDGLVKEECVHGLGYEINRSTYNDRHGTSYEIQQTNFVPAGDPVELQEVQVTNTSKTRKTIRVTVMHEFGGLDAQGKWGNRQRTLNIEEGEVVKGKRQRTVFVEPNYKHGPWSDSVFFTTYGTVRRTFTDLAEFLGPRGSRQTPKAILEDGYQAKMHPIYGGDAISAQEVELTLEPGETKSVRTVIGIQTNPEDKKFIKRNGKEVVDRTLAHKLIAKYLDPASFAKAFEGLKEAWEKQLFNLEVETCSKNFDRMINTWLQYQAHVTRAVSRAASRFESWLGRGLGFRDSLQDILGYVHSAPEKARERILELLSIQFPDGGAFHNFQPLTKKGNAAVGGGFNDDPCWVITALHAYLAETGDFSILQEKVKFSADPEKPRTKPSELKAVSVLEHARRAMAHVYMNLGPHGLPLIGHADWNDCLNLGLEDDPKKGANFKEQGYQIGKQKKTKAESLMIAGLFIRTAAQFAEICDEVGDKAGATKIRAKRADMIAAVEKHGWDGKWFRRAFDQDGKPVGSASRPEVGKIWIESQGWLGMAGVDEWMKRGWIEQALDSTDKYLASPWGLALLAKPMKRFNVKMGEVSAYLPGLKEGGGVFSHNNPWVAIANIGLGTKKGINRGYEYMERIAPWFFTPERLMQYQCEPNCFAQMTAGPTAAKHIRGQAKNSWTTGTAAWATVTFVEKILGLQRGLKGMTIDPSLPDKLIGDKPIRIKRGYRGDTLLITIENPGRVNHGVKEMYIDGVKVAGNFVKPFKDGKEHTIRVVMGKKTAKEAREEQVLATAV